MIVENEEELESCKPIPKGGAKLLVVLMFATLCSVSHILGINWITINIPGEDHGVWGAGLVFSMCVSVALVIWAASVVMGQNPTAWLGEYFRRNVRGRRIWYSLDDQGELVRESSQSSLESSFVNRIPLGQIHLELYLGGWFKRPRVIESGMCLGATVRIKQHKNSHAVTLIDESGDRVCLCIEHMLRILRHSHAPCFLDWPDIVRKLLRDISETKQLNREQAREFNGLKIKRDALLIVLEDIITKMKNTDRFGKSTEGQRLRESIEASLLYYLPEDDSRRYALEQAVAQSKQQEESGKTEEEQSTQEASDA